MDATEEIYAELIKKTLEIVTRIAGYRLPHNAVAYATEKYKSSIKRFDYERFEVTLELTGNKVQAGTKIFLEVVNYIRDIIGNSVNEYADEAIKSLEGRAKEKRVELPRKFKVD